eukprot:CAMPEP_0177665746 /NCGR_PEP_ID=MMETSP0447-20121125/21219_1 /TAXON_ID=0 /ORGANISM="Stygamoeba regulata, Strain BSH-02190019" /LENGTH=360 /DNA_ID=CAMNT_0019171861 /DNA_START=46 /DNA_END=1128 /DNA_ORIENTATION=-
MALELKRPALGQPTSSALVLKRQKTEQDAPASKQLIIGLDADTSAKLIAKRENRTSNLDSPIMQLTGHGGEVHSVKFNPDGKTLASASFDKTIFLWRVYGECENFLVLKGHKNAVLDLHWTTDGSCLYTASTDKTGALWDGETGQRAKKLAGHTACVNACSPARRGPPLLVTASDDSKAKLWDMRVRGCIHTFDCKFPATAISFNDNSDMFFTGGLDNVIKAWDMRTRTVKYTLTNHTNTVTSLCVSPDGSYLLSNSMDNTLKMFDIRPYVVGQRFVKRFIGHSHGFDRSLVKGSWSPDGTRVASGSADRLVYVWDVHTQDLQYKLPGHKGCVNEVVFHPDEPIIASGSADKSVFLGELE